MSDIVQPEYDLTKLIFYMIFEIVTAKIGKIKLRIVIFVTLLVYLVKITGEEFS